MSRGRRHRIERDRTGTVEHQRQRAGAQQERILEAALTVEALVPVHLSNGCCHVEQHDRRRGTCAEPEQKCQSATELREAGEISRDAWSRYVQLFERGGHLLRPTLLDSLLEVFSIDLAQWLGRMPPASPEELCVSVCQEQATGDYAQNE